MTMKSPGNEVAVLGIPSKWWKPSSKAKISSIFMKDEKVYCSFQLEVLRALLGTMLSSILCNNHCSVPLLTYTNASWQNCEEDIK